MYFLDEKREISVFMEFLEEESHTWSIQGSNFDTAAASGFWSEKVACRTYEYILLRDSYNNLELGFVFLCFHETEIQISPL